MQTLKQENIKLKKDNYMLKQQVQQMHKQLQDRTLNFWKRNQQPVSKRYVHFHRTYSNYKTAKIDSSHLQNQLQCKSKTIIQLTNTIQRLRQELLQYEDQSKRKSMVRTQEIKQLQNMNTDLVSHQECQEKFNEFIMVLQGKNKEISKLTKIIKEMEGNRKQKLQFIKNKDEQERRNWKDVKGKEKMKDEQSKLREENESLQNIIIKITEQINNVSIKNKMLQTSIINLEIDLQKQKQKKITTDFKGKTKRFQDLNQEMEILTQKLNESENENNQLELKINELTQKMKNIQQVNKKQTEKERLQMRKRIRRLQQEMKQKNETIVNMLEEKDELQKKLQKKERQYEIQNEKNKKQKYEQYLRKIGRGKVLQEEIKVNEQKIQQVRIKQDQKNKKIIQCENEANKKIIKLFEQQITMQKRKFDQIKSKYDQMRKENQELKQTKIIEKYKDQVKKEEKKNQNLKIKFLELSVNQKLREIQKLEKQQTQTILKQMTINQKQQQKESAKKQNQKLKITIEKLERQLKSKNQTISEMLKQMNENQKNTKAQNHRASNEQLEQIKMKMEYENRENRRIIEQLKISITYLEDNNSTLEKRIEESQAKNFEQKIKGQVQQKLRTQVNSLESYIEIFSKEMEKLKSESISIQQHNEKIQFLQGRLKNKQQSLLQISEVINAANIKNSQQKQEMMKRIRELEEELLNFKQLPQSMQTIRIKDSSNQTEKLKKWIDMLEGQLRNKNNQTLQQLLKQSQVKNIQPYQSTTNIYLSQQYQLINMRCQIQSLQLKLQTQKEINKSLLNQISCFRQNIIIDKQLTKPIQKSKSQLQNYIQQLIKQNQFYKIHSKFYFNHNIQIKQSSPLLSQVQDNQVFKRRNIPNLQTTPIPQQSNLYQSIIINMQTIQSKTLDTFQQFLLANPQIQQKIKKVYKNTEQLTLIKLCQIVFDFHKTNQNLIEQKQSLKAKELEIEIKNFEDKYFLTQESKQREKLKNQIAYLSKTLQTKNSQLNTILTQLKDTKIKAEKALIKEKEYIEYKQMYQNLLNQNKQLKYQLQNKNINQQQKAKQKLIIEQLQIENQHLNQIMQKYIQSCKSNSALLKQVRYQLKQIKIQQISLKQNSQKYLSNLRTQIIQHYYQLWQEKRKFTQYMLEHNLLIENIVDLVKCDNKQLILEALKQKLTLMEQMEQKIDYDQLTLKQFEEKIHQKNQEINKLKALLYQKDQRLVQLEQQYEKEQYQLMLQKQKEKFVELFQCNKQMMKQNQLNKKIILEKEQIMKEKVEQFKCKESLFIAKNQQNESLKKQLQNMKQIIKQIKQNKKKINQQLQDRQSELFLKNMELQTYKLKSDNSPQKLIQNQEEIEKLKNQLELQNQTIQTLKNQQENERKNYQLLEAKTKEIWKIINEEVLKEISEDFMLPNQSIEQNLCFTKLQDLKKIKLNIHHKIEGIKRFRSYKQDQINIEYYNKQFEAKKMEYQKIINGLKQRIISLEFSFKMLSIKEIDEKDLKQFFKKIQGYQEQNEKQIFKQTIINFIKKLVEKQKNMTKKLDKEKTELVQKQIEICQIQGQIKTLKNDNDVKKMELQKKDESIQMLIKQVKQYEQSLHQSVEILKQKSDLLNDLQTKFKQLNNFDKEYQFQKKIDQLQKKSGEIIFRQQSLRQSNNEQRSRFQKTYSFYSNQITIGYYQQLIEKLKEVLKKINRQNYSNEIQEISNLLYLKEEKQNLQRGWDDTREFKYEKKQLLLKKQFDKISEQDKQKQFDIQFQNQFLRNELQQKQKIIRILSSQIETYRQELSNQKRNKQQEISQLNHKIKQMQKELKHQQKKIQLKNKTFHQGDLKYQEISEISQGSKFKNRRINRNKTYHKEQKYQQQQNSFEVNNSKVRDMTSDIDKISMLKRKSRKEYKQAQQRLIQLLKKEISRLNLKVSNMRQLQKQNEVLRNSKNKLQQEIKEVKPEYKIILEQLHQSEYRNIVQDIVIQLKKNQVIPKNFILQSIDQQSSFDKNKLTYIVKFNQEKLIRIQFLIDRIIAMENISGKNCSQDQLIEETQIVKRKLQFQKKKNKYLELDFERNQKLKKFSSQIIQVNQQNYDQIISELKMQLELINEKWNKKNLELKAIIIQKDKLQLLIEYMQSHIGLKQQNIADLQKNQQLVENKANKTHSSRKTQNILPFNFKMIYKE